MQIWVCSGSDRQKWSIATDGSNNIRLTGADHLCLNIDGGKTVDGTNVDVATCDKSNPKSQQVGSTVAKLGIWMYNSMGLDVYYVCVVMCLCNVSNNTPVHWNQSILVTL